MTKSTPITQGALRVRKHREGAGIDKVREAGRKNTAAHRARKGKEKHFYQHWINHYRALLHEPLFDYMGKKNSTKNKSRPTYYPPEEEARKMTSEDLQEWRRTQKLERKRASQAKADREKREELELLRVEFKRVKEQVFQVHGPEALLHRNDDFESYDVHNPQRTVSGQTAAVDISARGSSRCEAKAQDPSKWGIFNQVVSKLFYDEVGESPQAGESRECTPANVAVRDKFGSTAYTSKDNHTDKAKSMCGPKTADQSKERPPNLHQREGVFLPIISQRQKVLAASKTMNYIVANSGLLTPALLKAYPLHFILRDVHRSFFEDGDSEVRETLRYE